MVHLPSLELLPWLTSLILEATIKTSITLVGVLLAMRWMKHTRPAVRHCVLVVAIVAITFIPLASYFLPPWNSAPLAEQFTFLVDNSPNSPQKPALFSTAHAFPRIAANSSPPPAAGGEPMYFQVAPGSAARAESLNTLSHIPDFSSGILRTGFAALWLAGVLTLLMILVVKRIRIVLLSRQGNVVHSGFLFDTLQACCLQLGYRRQVRLLIDDLQQAPMTFGVVRPVIVLPGNAVEWSTTHLRSALLHELGHICRGDCLTQMLVHLACILNWFNPLVWILARKIHIEREQACDDFVLRNGIRASDYAEQLIGLVSQNQHYFGPVSALISMADHSGFAQRLKAILNAPQARPPLGRQTIHSIVLTFAAITLLLSTANFSFSQSAKEQAPPAPPQETLNCSTPLKPDDSNLAAPAQERESRQVSQPSLNSISPPLRLESRCLNIVFAHDPGRGQYDGVVGSRTDIWNFVDLGTTAVDFTRYSDATPSSARLRITRHDGEWGISNQTGIFHGYIYHNCQCVDLETQVLDLAAGKYTAYVFAHGDAPNQNAEIELKVGNQSIGRKATANDGTWDFRTQPYREGLQYVRFEFEVREGENITFISHRAGSDYSMFNAIQIVPRQGSASGSTSGVNGLRRAAPRGVFSQEPTGAGGA